MLSHPQTGASTEPHQTSPLQSARGPKARPGRLKSARQQQAPDRDAIVGRDETIRNLNRTLAAISAARRRGVPPRTPSRRPWRALLEDLERRLSAGRGGRRAPASASRLEAGSSTTGGGACRGAGPDPGSRGRARHIETAAADRFGGRNGRRDRGGRPAVSRTLSAYARIMFRGARVRELRRDAGTMTARSRKQRPARRPDQRADAVLFPVDCVRSPGDVAGEASLRQRASPSLLRSAGLSSFAWPCASRRQRFNADAVPLRRWHQLRDQEDSDRPALTKALGKKDFHTYADKLKLETRSFIGSKFVGAKKGRWVGEHQRPPARRSARVARSGDDIDAAVKGQPQGLQERR